jgi:hypothetical protein
MKCDEAREYLSALYDGEKVPRQAAEHTARCASCQELLKGYAETGAALRGYGSLLVAEPVPDRIWLKTERNKTMWWEKGLQMMRIPRVAFACLLVLLVVLSSRLALIEVRAHADGSVLMLKLTPSQGDSIRCDLSTSDTKNDGCGGLAQIDKSNLFYAVKALKKDGSRVLLSIRTKVTPLGPAGFGPETANRLPETQSWFTPGETLTLPNTGALELTLTGEWTDHIPVGGHQLLDPGPNQIRLFSTLLLKNNTVAGDLGSMSAFCDRPGEGVSFYVPGEGRFILSATPIAGAVPATVQFNRVTFESNGQKYVIVNGMPVSRAEKLWVLHDPAYKPQPDPDQGPSIGAGPLAKLL